MNTPRMRSAARLAAPCGTVVNDQHSALNATAVKRILRPESLIQLCEIVKSAVDSGTALSIAGGRHAMGGQQFLQNGFMLDVTALNRALEFDSQHGTIRIEAGATWPVLLEELQSLQPARPGSSEGTFWTFAQKQTGADHLTIGGALAANMHGRGLKMRPFVQDVVSFDLIGPDGRLLRCSRTENADLFRLVIGGYGLFGVVYAVTLQLVPRQAMRRWVQIGTVDELMPLFAGAIQRGAVYGDFQFAIDPRSDDFLQRGVFAVYQPAPGEAPRRGDQKSLTPLQWERLWHLAHADKARAYQEYSDFYKSTHGQIYWSDQQQLSYYPREYHRGVDEKLGSACRGSEMITELYVPRQSLPAFLRGVRIFARRYGWNIVYGTIRLIEHEEETFLAWARESWACVVFNLCVEHSASGLEAARSAFRCLIQIAINHGGSYYLTYHKWATPDQLLACYPQFPEFLKQKSRFDPRGIYTSNWHQACRSMV